MPETALRRPYWLLALVTAIALAIPAAKALLGQNTYPFQDPDLPADQRIHNILALLTLQEKIDLLGKNMNVPRLGIHGSAKIDSIPGSSGQFEGIHGITVGGPGNWNLKSPGVPGAPGLSGGTSVIPTTQFPQPIGLGQTWDPALVQKATTEVGYEARYIFQSYDRGGLIVRGPYADLARDPRWGRTEESFGEDPYLAGTLSASFARGLQGNDPRYWQAASIVVPFLANTNEDNRSRSSSDFDNRLLHEYYAVPHRMAIEEGGADGLMASYNAVNGVPMAANPMLRDLVMQNWGFNGIIDTDRGALTFLVTDHKFYNDMANAAAGTIHSGINQYLDAYPDAVMTALKKHLITEADIDRNLEGLLRVMVRLGFLDPPARVPYSGISVSDLDPAKGAPWNWPENKALARRATDESIVLLKNEGQTLPLDASKLKSIAVIGPAAGRVLDDLYGGTPPYAINPLEGIRKRAGSGVSVQYATGNDLKEAADLARRSSVAIVIIGNNPTCGNGGWIHCSLPSEGHEGQDRTSLTLEQEQIAKAVFAANPRTIVVLKTSFPYTTTWSQEHVPAILEMAHSSEEEGNGLADVLFGDYDPAGRLTITWVASMDQLPPMMDYDIRHGRTYMYFREKPLFAFGHGLSYTKFDYSDAHLNGTSFRPEDTMELSFTLKNSGRRDGDEVAQVYCRHLDSVRQQPKQALCGFERAGMRAGQETRIRLAIPVSRLRYWDSIGERYIVESGQYELLLGAASDDIRVRLPLKIVGGVSPGPVPFVLGIAGRHQIVSEANKLCWNVVANSIKSGDAIIPYPCDAHSDNMEFRFVDRGGGFYSIHTMNGTQGLCLNISRASPTPGDGKTYGGAGNLIQWTCEATSLSDNELFQVVAVGENRAQVRVKNSGLCLEDPGRGGTIRQNLCAVSAPNQTFTITGEEWVPLTIH